MAKDVTSTIDQTKTTMQLIDDVKKSLEDFVGLMDDVASTAVVVASDLSESDSVARAPIGAIFHIARSLEHGKLDLEKLIDVVVEIRASIKSREAA